ncbi:unnamed protein product [Soboliphyme baturini]|uniref:oxaloacetate tautomerase n=1 Tax=Soboliphyme baturini TaxID=241478 RepID=A0A183IU79_9BILA|nr:unnamed protein product [Soboliphyme baturini]
MAATVESAIRRYAAASGITWPATADDIKDRRQSKFSLAVVFCWITHAGFVPTVERKFACDDPSISLPLKPNTVSLSLLLTVCICFPLTTIVCIEYSLCRRSKLKNKHAVFFDVVSQVVREFFFGLFLVIAVMLAAKAAVGRLRPHFLSVCRPNISSGQCRNGLILSPANCNAASGHALKTARESFPSGHAAVSVYAFMFLMFYCRSKCKFLISHKFLAITLVAIDIAWTATCCITRVTDHWHHTTDVVAGCIIGVASLSAMLLRKNPMIFVQNNNYVFSDIASIDHAAELKNPVPETPVLFIKPSSAIIEERENIKIPEGCQNLQQEVELGVVIGKKATRLSSEQAHTVIGGYILALDMTARDFQTEAKQTGNPWLLAKGFDTSCPISRLVSKSEMTSHDDATVPHDLHLWCRINGELKQDGRTSQMIFPIPTLIEYITKYITLEPGDLLLTGTPAGVTTVHAGDVIECGITNIVKMQFSVSDGRSQNK